MTLIELLIAVVIVGIIAAVAYPSYTNHVIKSHRTVALSDLSRIQLELETSYDGGYDWSHILSGGTCTLCDSDKIDFLSILRALQVRPIPLQQQQNRLWDKTTTSA